MGSFFETFTAVASHALVGAFEEVHSWTAPHESSLPRPQLVSPNDDGVTYVYLTFAGDLPWLVSAIQHWSGAHESDQFILVTPDWLSEEEMSSVPDSIRVLHCGDFFAYGYVTPLGEGQFDGFHQYINRETGHELSERLHNLPVGRAFAKEFENLVRDILVYVFAEKIAFETEQVRDLDGLKIRDLVFRITDPYHTWDWIRREVAKSSLFVVEAKNEQRPPGAKHIRQVADYLKPNGIGLFGVLVSRAAPSRQVMRDVVQRRAGGDGISKTILVLDQSDLLDLLLSRMGRRYQACDDYVRRRIVQILVTV